MTEATPDPGTDTTPADDGPTPSEDTGSTPGLDSVQPKKEPELITLPEASDLAGVSVGALRKRYRSGDLERRYADDGRVLLDADAVRRLYRVSQDTDQKEPAAELHSVQPKKEPAPEVPEGSLLVPVSAWEKMLEQLGNLHTAGQEIAEARERAARAEEREAFAQQRRQEAENRARAAEERLAALEGNTPGPDLEEGLTAVTPPNTPTPPTEVPAPAEETPGFVRSLIRRVRSR